MSKYSIFEGVKFGNKEKQLVLQNSSDFNIGIEYEFNVDSSEPQAPEDIIDFDQDVDDYLRDIRDYVDDHGVSMDAIFGHIVIDVIDDNNIVEDIPFILYDIYQLLAKLSEVLTDALKSDTETEDMFDTEKKEALFKLFIETLTNEDLYEEEIARALKNYSYMGIHDFSLIMTIMDVYFTGEFIKGSHDKISDFYDIYTICHENPGIFELTEDDVDENNYMDNDVDVVSELLSTLMSGSLRDAYLDLDNNYEVSSYGFRSNEFDINEYIDYVLDVGSVPHLTDAIVSDFRMRINDGELESESTLDLDDLRSTVSNIDMVTDDHNDMTEVITRKMDVEDAIDNIQSMFRFINDHGEVHDYAGMHISISTNKYDLEDFNVMKFATLMHLPYILQYFPERNFVSDLQQIIEKNIEEYVLKYIIESVDVNEGMVGFVKRIIKHVESSINTNKFQSIKFGDYEMLDGRIELRFFGGEDYHRQYDEIMNMLLRSLYLMNIAYTDAYTNDYYKQVVKVINTALSNELPVSYSHLYKSLSAINSNKSIEDSFQYYADNKDIDEKTSNVWKKYLTKDWRDIFVTLYQTWNLM